MTLPYIHLSLAERREIARIHAAKISLCVIADRLQRHRSSIYRKIKRNCAHDEEPLYRGYYHVAADMQARPGVSVWASSPANRCSRSMSWAASKLDGRQSRSRAACGHPVRLKGCRMRRSTGSSTLLQGQKLGPYQDPDFHDPWPAREP